MKTSPHCSFFTPFSWILWNLFSVSNKYLFSIFSQKYFFYLLAWDIFTHCPSPVLKLQPCPVSVEAPRPSDLLYLDFHLGSHYYFGPLFNHLLLPMYLYLKSLSLPDSMPPLMLLLWWYLMAGFIAPPSVLGLCDLSALLNIISQALLLEALSSPNSLTCQPVLQSFQCLFFLQSLTTVVTPCFALSPATFSSEMI